MSVNSNMLARDEEEAGVGIAACCLFTFRKHLGSKIPPEEKLSFQLSQCHLFPVCCNFILSSFSAWLHPIISLWICCTVLWSHLCCIFLLSDAETELNKSWYIFICWFSMCRLVWTDFFLVSFKKKLRYQELFIQTKQKPLGCCHYLTLATVTHQILKNSTLATKIFVIGFAMCKKCFMVWIYFVVFMNWTKWWFFKVWEVLSPALFLAVN